MSLTDSQMGAIIRDMVIIVDTREQKNDHILNHLKTSKIPYVIQKLETADYSFYLPNYPELNVDRKFLVEKKNSLEEISGNFTKDRERFTKEFERVKEESIHLVIENATWNKLLNGTYRSKIHPTAFMASMITWSIRYNCPIWFVGTKESPTLIYNILKYCLLEHLKTLDKQ